MQNNPYRNLPKQSSAAEVFVAVISAVNIETGCIFQNHFQFIKTKFCINLTWDVGKHLFFKWIFGSQNPIFLRGKRGIIDPKTLRFEMSPLYMGEYDFMFFWPKIALFYDIIRGVLNTPATFCMFLTPPHDQLHAETATLSLNPIWSGLSWTKNLHYDLKIGVLFYGQLFHSKNQI